MSEFLFNGNLFGVFEICFSEPRPNILPHNDRPVQVSDSDSGISSLLNCWSWQSSPDVYRFLWNFSLSCVIHLFIFVSCSLSYFISPNSAGSKILQITNSLWWHLSRGSLLRLPYFYSRTFFGTETGGPTPGVFLALFLDPVVPCSMLILGPQVASSYRLCRQLV